MAGNVGTAFKLSISDGCVVNACTSSPCNDVFYFRRNSPYGWKCKMHSTTASDPGRSDGDGGDGGGSSHGRYGFDRLLDLVGARQQQQKQDRETEALREKVEAEAFTKEDLVVVPARFNK
jgi:hypothetical protein